MPRDLFGDVTRPFKGVGARSRYTVPLSIAAHTAAVVSAVVVPLLAIDALPDLQSRLEYNVVTPLVPPEPPRPRVVRPPDAPAVNPNAAPTAAPEGITKERVLPSDSDLGGDEGLGIITGIDHAADLLTPPPPPPPPPQPRAPIRVGTGRISAPAKIHDVAPVYPAIAQAARVSGLVIVQATIGVDGAVTDAVVLRAVPLLDQAALEAVRQWRYTPTRLDGQPVAVVMTVTVNFQLR